jgi:hypothetical protein
MLRVAPKELPDEFAVARRSELLLMRLLQLPPFCVRMCIVVPLGVITLTYIDV